MKTEESELSIFDALLSQRAVRHFRSDAVPTPVIESILYYATRAPSGGNRQPWEFVVVTDPVQRSRLGDIYRQCSKQLFEARLSSSTDDGSRYVYRDALYLSDHMAEAPVLIVVCVRVPEGQTLERQSPSIYPAVQNILLAARGHGLGSVLTDAHKQAEDTVRALLGLPNGVETVCIVPIGYPVDAHRAFRPVHSRRPLAEVLHWDRFDPSVSDR